MSQYDAVMNKLNQHLKDCGLKKARVELDLPEGDDDDGRAEARIFIPYNELPVSGKKGAELVLALSQKTRHLNVRTVIKTEAKLVHAKLGDYVLLFADYYHAKEEFHVGIVTSIFGSGESVRYGVRHLVCRRQIEIPSIHGMIELTQDNYGGHPKGFIKVISEQQAIRNVRQQAWRFTDGVRYFFDKEMKELPTTIRRIHEGATETKFIIRTCDPMKEAGR